MASGTLSSSSLDRYTCIALAGVAAEYVHFGQAEGGLNDVQQLDGLLKHSRYASPLSWIKAVSRLSAVFHELGHEIDTKSDGVSVLGLTFWCACEGCCLQVEAIKC